MVEEVWIVHVWIFEISINKIGGLDFFKIIFDVVYIVKKDVCPCGPLIRMGTVKK